MCVIVHQPAGSYLSKKTAQEMWERNPDGGGFAFIEGNEVKSDKAMSFPAFWSKFESARSARRDTDFLVHFRIATSGKVGLDNTHPFRVDPYTVMAHNGMLNSIVGKIDINAPLSDTRTFIEEVIKELPENWLDNRVLVEMMEDYIDFNKLMFLTTNPALKKNVYILNEDLGVQRNHMWWSNDYHIVRKPAKTYTTQQAKPFTTTPAKVTKEPKKENEKLTELKNLYQLPLPTDQRRTPTDEEIHEFWEDRRSFYSPLPEDAEKASRALKALRKERGLDPEDILFDPVGMAWECQRCYTYVDDMTGDCECWNLICILCGALAPYCVHDADDADLVMLEDAPKAFAERSKETDSRW